MYKQENIMAQRYKGDCGQKRDETPNPIGQDQKPPAEFFDFISSEDPPSQRRVFGYLRAADTETRGSYFSAAVRMVTSDRFDLVAKKKVLKSLAAFVKFSEEGLFEYAPPSLSIRDSAYIETMDCLADYLGGDDIPQDEYKEVVECLTHMDYFRVKRTMMLSFVEYFYPHDADWYAKRLRLCVSCLQKGEDVAAFHVLSFLFHSYDVLEQLLLDPDAKEQKISPLRALLSILDSVVPQWLLSNDYKVVTSACLYCNRRRLVETLPLLEQIKGSENEMVRVFAEATIKKIGESRGTEEKQKK